MNWSKAKTILIIVLVLTNVFLLSVYTGNKKEQENQISESTRSAILYLENRNIDIKCDVPEGVEKLPVVSVYFRGGIATAGTYQVNLDGITLEILGLGDGNLIKSIEITDNIISTLPAYTALLKSAGSISDEITGIELIYLVDRSAYMGQEGEDTALPYWKISSGENSYYYSAFAE